MTTGVLQIDAYGLNLAACEAKAKEEADAFFGPTPYKLRMDSAGAAAKSFDGKPGLFLSHWLAWDMTPPPPPRPNGGMVQPGTYLA